MTVKERLVEIIQSAGYDMLTACELAEQVIREVKQDTRRKIVYYVGNVEIIIKKG